MATPRESADGGPLANIRSGRILRLLVDMRCVGPDSTGIGRYGANLILSLQRVSRNQLHVVALSSARGADYLRTLGWTGETVITPGADGWDAFGLPDLLRQRDADILHSPIFVLPLIRTCATICTVHDAIPLVRPELAPASFHAFFKQHALRALRSATCIVTVSEHSKTDIIREAAIDPARVVAIHEPVSPLFTPGRMSREFILAVGALDDRKNLRTLFAAYAQLTTPPPLVVVGGPNGYDPRPDVDRFGLQNTVRILGRISDGELARCYRSAIALAFPSLYEGFGLPVVEAMASGTPVIASNASSIPEVAGDAAILVDPKDVPAWTAALARVIGDAELQRSLAAKGVERARQFSLEAQGQRLAELYRSIVDGRP